MVASRFVPVPPAPLSIVAATAEPAARSAVRTALVSPQRIRVASSSPHHFARQADFRRFASLRL
jgi:hypothetical protein